MTERIPLRPLDIERAMVEPASVFATPEEVLAHEELTREQKIEILWRWEYDAAELAVAVEEGMPGEENGLLRRVMLALGTLTGPIDMEHTGPTKHHGLARPAVTRR
jgi:hypothetical protein